MENFENDFYLNPGTCFFPSILKKIGIEPGLLLCWAEEWRSFITEKDIVLIDQEKNIFFRWPYAVVEKEFSWSRKTQRDFLKVLERQGLISKTIREVEYGTITGITIHQDKFLELRKEVRK